MAASTASRTTSQVIFTLLTPHEMAKAELRGCLILIRFQRDMSNPREAGPGGDLLRIVFKS
jgi:hypothetical protein